MVEYTGIPECMKATAHRRLGYLVDEIDNLAECTWLHDGLIAVLQRELRADNYFLDEDTCRAIFETYVTEHG